MKGQNKVDGYPVSDLQDYLRRVLGASCCSSIDLKAEFQNIPTDYDSQQFMGIMTKDGVHYSLRHSFELTNTLAHTAATIACGNVSVVLYLDNIMIYGNHPVRVW